MRCRKLLCPATRENNQRCGAYLGDLKTGDECTLTLPCTHHKPTLYVRFVQNNGALTYRILALQQVAAGRTYDEGPVLHE